jgi:hypothetical protein
MSEPLPSFRRDDRASHARTFLLGGLTAGGSMALPQALDGLSLAVPVGGLILASVLFALSGRYALRGGQGVLTRFSGFPRRFSPHEIRNFSPQQRLMHARLSALAMFLFAAATLYGAVFIALS